MLSRSISFVIVICTFFMSNSPAVASEGNTTPAQNDATQTYANEVEVVFENDGQKVQAFEGSIQVPENRSDKNSRSIPLHYLRFPATGKDPGSPIIYLSGGPGGSGIGTVSYPGFRFPLFMALREFGDVIALDQRGTGKSRTASKCTSNQSLPLNQALSESLVIQRYRLAANECVAFWKSEGVDAMGYTTVESASDIDQLRQHFSAEKVTLWGISYGSHLAFASLKVMPGKIDKMIIASAEGLNQTVKLPARTDAYFDRLQLAINGQPKAAQAYPDIKALMRRVHERLDENPIQLKVPQENAEPIDFLFQRMHMQGIASAMIADPHRGVPMMLQLYSALDQGDSQMLPAIITRAGLDQSDISFDVMSFAMDIASGVTEPRLQLFNQQAGTSIVGKSLNFPMPQLNKAVDGLDLGDEFRQYPRSDVATLLLTGTLDGRTYIKSQQEATQGLTNLTQVMVNNAGHNLFMVSPKVTEVILQFMNNETIEETEIEFQLPDFVK
jgi:pimeloyl-ACP methyl ester carboxylesterase